MVFNRQLGMKTMEASGLARGGHPCIRHSLQQLLKTYRYNIIKCLVFCDNTSESINKDAVKSC